MFFSLYYIFIATIFAWHNLLALLLKVLKRNDNNFDGKLTGLSRGDFLFHFAQKFRLLLIESFVCKQIQIAPNKLFSRTLVCFTLFQIWITLSIQVDVSSHAKLLYKMFCEFQHVFWARFWVYYRKKRTLDWLKLQNQFELDSTTIEQKKKQFWTHTHNFKKYFLKNLNIWVEQ